MASVVAPGPDPDKAEGLADGREPSILVGPEVKVRMRE